MRRRTQVSVLYREPKLLKYVLPTDDTPETPVSVLYREPKLLKLNWPISFLPPPINVSVLYREPKLLKFKVNPQRRLSGVGFSALP